MDTTTIQPNAATDANAVHRLVKELKQCADSLGKDDSFMRVREGVRALRVAINDGSGTVGATLLALEANVDLLHMSHMRPLIKQTLRDLRTALDMDVVYTRQTARTSTWNS